MTMTLQQGQSSADQLAAPRQTGATRNGKRFTIFLAVFLASAAASLAYVYQRPAVYESTASLLVTPPADRAALAAALPSNPQAVGMERHALMTNSLLDLLSNRLNRAAPVAEGEDWSVPTLQDILWVERFEETNIVRLWARGADPTELPLLLNAWIDVYLEIQADFQESLYSETDRELVRQAAELQERVEIKRDELALFRDTNDIVSMEREENRAVSRLRGLSLSLDEAREEVVKASANLETVTLAVARGEVVAGREDRIRISELEDEVAIRRSQIADFRQRFTDAFIPLDRDIQLAFQELESYELQLAERRRVASERAIEEARRELASARQTAEELTRQLSESEREISAFSGLFAEHEALTEELRDLENAYRDTNEQQVRRQVDRDRAVTQVEVLERANEPSEPSWPNYTRDAAIAVGGSALLGFIVVLAFDFFTRPPPQTGVQTLAPITIGTMTSPRVFHEDAELVEEAPARPRLARQEPAAEPEPEIAELPVEAVHRLLRAATPKTRALIALLLSGVSGSELLAIEGEDLDTQQGTLQISGLSHRTIALPDSVRRSIARADFRTSRGGQTILRHKTEERYSLAELDGLISRAADDAELPDAAKIDAAQLRHSYLAYLARQGADLAALQDVVGRIPPSTRAAYARLAPTDGPRPRQEITLEYPGLDELA